MAQEIHEILMEHPTEHKRALSELYVTIVNGRAVASAHDNLDQIIAETQFVLVNPAHGLVGVNVEALILEKYRDKEFNNSRQKQYIGKHESKHDLLGESTIRQNMANFFVRLPTQNHQMYISQYTFEHFEGEDEGFQSFQLGSLFLYQYQFFTHVNAYQPYIAEECCRDLRALNTTHKRANLNLPDAIGDHIKNILIGERCLVEDIKKSSYTGMVARGLLREIKTSSSDSSSASSVCSSSLSSSFSSSTSFFTQGDSKKEEKQKEEKQDEKLSAARHPLVVEIECLIDKFYPPTITNSSTGRRKWLTSLNPYQNLKVTQTLTSEQEEGLNKIKKELDQEIQKLSEAEPDSLHPGC